MIYSERPDGRQLWDGGTTFPPNPLLQGEHWAPLSLRKTSKRTKHVRTKQEGLI
jgi:hypothetical protein